MRSDKTLLCGYVLIAVGLGLLALWPLRPAIATVVYNNIGSILLNRALLAPNVAPEAQVDQAMRAGKSFQTALAWDPLNGQAYYNLGTIYDLWQDAPSAARTKSRAAVLNPRDISARFAHGQALVAHSYGDEDRAVQEWRAAGAAVYFVNQGLRLAGEGDLAGAIAQHERAIAIAPDMPEGYYYLGKTLSRMGRQEEALAALESAAALESPHSPRRYLLRAEVYATRGEWQAALEAFRQATSLAPQDPVPLYRMGWILDQRLGDRQSAIAHYQWAVQTNPDYTPPRLALAQLYEEQGDCDEASRWLAHFFSADVGSGLAGEAHALLGRCLLQQRREGEALRHLEQALTLKPDSVSYHLALAQGYSQAGRYHDAIEVYLRVLERQPDNGQAQQALEELGWFGATDDGQKTR